MPISGAARVPGDIGGVEVPADVPGWASSERATPSA
eukprot:CAMPEP_0168481960 /NCGR_PEP_ID=MMETSP0228-20121227/64786_1 /TAXON_ID=133427 /ORGANISM="Protoceratium reticulatum, Strain CCCM 535 (=CCMP 1889)" /LENGTH=35 /DNA_ID= /DNA_START= /DNA_END= /DNA_ORIENTATION=